ncbi:MAG: hypothetical protein J6X26_03880 [Bacteroidales bacterium]|nr:hypothetical protein [Bacteroidales bacterium]
MDNKKNYMKRRSLLKGLASLPIAIGLSKVDSYGQNLSADKKYISDENMALLQELKGTMPKGNFWNWEISRLTIGCNPMGGWSHSRDLSYVGTLSGKWHTHEKIKETWAIAEQAGINFANLAAFQYPIFNEFKKETGSKMLCVSQCSIGKEDDRLLPLREAVDGGVDCIYIQGENTDSLAENKQLDCLHDAYEFTHKQNMPFGIGAHSIQTIKATIEAGIKADFYYKTFHHDRYWSAIPREYRVEYPKRPRITVSESSDGRQLYTYPDRNQWNDNMWDLFNDQTIEFFKTVKVPLFGFKVLAAGAIKPADGIRWAFENGSDFVCMGMYDFQIVEDVNTTIDILSTLGKRERPWCS